MNAKERLVGRIANLQVLRGRLQSWLAKDETRGVYKVDRAAFTDPEIFELELKVCLRTQLGVRFA
ncbi:hypothetical protein [Sphingobium xenophagum]|uniref:hypothetical protein n=1 Tax=Sphingobium xenophagum TaxID=121428 RepID=UPI0020CCCD2F|nr:hypothetical protein [Sphingobium xenophagum]